MSRVIYAERRFNINRARFADALAKRDAQHATEKLLSNTLAERDAQHARDFSDLHSKMARDANLAQELSDVQAGNMQKMMTRDAQHGAAIAKEHKKNTAALWPLLDSFWR